MRKALFAVVVAAAAVIGWLTWQQTQTPPFIVSGFIEADEIRVGSRIAGRVAEVLVEEGQAVRVGTELYRIEPLDLKERLAGAQAALAARQAEYARLKAGFRSEEIEQARAKRDRVKAELEKLVAGPRPQEIEIARQRLAGAQADLDLAQSEYERLTRLAEHSQASKTEMDGATRTYKSALAAAGAAQQEVALLEAGTRAEDIAKARAALAESEGALALREAGYRREEIEQAAAGAGAAEAEVAAIQKQVEETTVVSPCDCSVEAIDLRPGDLVSANAPTVSLLDPARMWVRTYVPESRLGAISVGQRVPIRVDGFGDRRFKGRVSFIAQQAEFTPRNIQTPEERSKQVFRIKAKLEDGLDVLRVGMMADVLFEEMGNGELRKSE